MTTINMDVMTGVDFKVPESVAAKAATLTGDSNNTIKNKVASLAYLYGSAAKLAQVNVAPTFKVPFNAWRVAHYVGDRKMPKDASLATMLGGFNGLCGLGYFKPYDTTAVANIIIGKGNIAYSDMGSWAERVMAAFPETAPTEAQVNELAPVKKAATAKSDAAKGEATAKDLWGQKGTWAKFLDTPEKKLAAMDLISAFETFNAMMPEDPADADAVDYKAEARKLRAVIKAAADKAAADKAKVGKAAGK